jgi:hypothetical protein
MALSTGVLAATESLDACLGFLLRHQSPDGSWSDWDLPPGPSDCWTTAYIGRRLAAATEPLLSTSTAARRAAAAWLVERQLAGGGWGYNDSVGPDADSTAYALLFLSSEPVAIPSAGYERLLEFQRPDGGFSTFLSDEGLGSWGVSHPDVTAVAARAMLSVSGSDVALPGTGTGPAPDRLSGLDGALRYIFRERNADGTWDSFWWSSPLYTTAAALSLLRATGSAFDAALTRSALSRVHAGNAFERALLLDCHLQTLVDLGGSQAPQLVDALIAEQLPDGSWPSVPILRLTNRDCFDPAGQDDAGPLFADPGRLFTSAVVLGALSRFIGDGRSRWPPDAKRLARDSCSRAAS